MRAGKYKWPIVIQQKTETGTDDFGGPVYTWATFKTARAAHYPMKGRDLATAASNKGEMVVRFDIRYQSGITQAMRILFDGLYHNITAVSDVDGKRKELQIMTTTGVNEG